MPRKGRASRRGRTTTRRILTKRRAGRHRTTKSRRSDDMWEDEFGI